MQGEDRVIYREETGKYTGRTQENIQKGNRKIYRENTGKYTGRAQENI